MRVLVLSTKSNDSQDILWSIKRLGFHSFVIGDPNLDVSLRLLPLFEQYYPIPEGSSFLSLSVEIASLMESICRDRHIDIIVPSGFDSILFLSEHKGRIASFVKVMPVPSPETIKLLNDKHNFAMFCLKNKIPHPKTHLLNNIEDLYHGSLPVRFPLLTKPLSMTAGKGIIRFDEMKSLLQYMHVTRKDMSNALPILLQEFIPGDDIDFNAFCSNGELNAWTIQRSISIHSDERTQLRWLEFANHPDVFRIGKEILRNICYTGPAHIDMRINSQDGSVSAIEFNPRFWASTLASLADGVNFIKVGIDAAFDSSISITPRSTNRIWGSFIKTLLAAFSKRDMRLFRMLPRFTIEQARYVVDRLILKLFLRIKTVLSVRKNNACISKGIQ